MLENKTTSFVDYRKRKKITKIFTYIFMIFLAVFFLFPIVFMIISSIKENEFQVITDMSSLRAFLPVGQLGLQNFRDVYASLDFGRQFFNSLFVMLVTVFSGLLVNSMIAYALARLRFKGKNILLSTIIALIIIPFEAVAVPLLIIVSKLPWFGGATSWLDTYHVQIFPFIADAFSIYLFYQFFINIPKDLEEAALIDGASLFGIYRQIVILLSRPIIATVAILQSLNSWNRFMWPMMVTRMETVRPLTVGIQNFFGQSPRLWGDFMAFAFMIPFLS